MALACVTAPAADPALLRAWIAYHGYLFGFEHLHVLAAPMRPGAHGFSATDRVLADYAGLGVTVHRLGAIGFSRRRAEICHADPGPYVLADRCDIFLAMVGETHVTGLRSDILAELDRATTDGVQLRNPSCLISLPGTRDIFALADNDDALRVIPRPPDDETGGTAQTRLISITLAVRATQDPIPDTLVRLRLWPALVALLAPDAPSSQPALPPGTLLIDIEATGFTRSGYADANPDTRDIDPFVHFVANGYLEGRRASASATSHDEVATRLAFADE